MIGVGLIGSGFISDTYADALQDVRNAVLVATYSRDLARAEALGRKWAPDARSYDDMARFAPTPSVDLVVVALPNEAHLDAVRVAAAAGKGVVCTKPLARTGAEAAEILRVVREAGVWHGYAESSVFSPNIAKAHQMVAAGAIGDVLTMRAREAHSGPHAAHFWDAETAGGGALLDMGCHTVESARHFFGKDNPIVEVFAWGATLAHADKTTGEDTAIALLKFAGGQLATVESSWIEKGGMQLRHEIVGSAGRLVTDTASTPVWGFIENPCGISGGEGRRRHGLGLPRSRRGARLRIQPGDAPLRRLLRPRTDAAARPSRTAVSSTASSTPVTSPCGRGRGKRSR